MKLIDYRLRFVRRMVTLLVIHICMAAIVVIHAQIPKILTSSHGLTTSGINSVYEDSRGMLWICGPSMLDVYDGSRFHHINFIDKETGKRLFNTAYQVVEAGDGHYWVATSSGLYDYDYKKYTFEHILLNSDEDPVSGFPINSMLKMPQKDCLLVVTGGYGMYVLNTAERKVDKAMNDKLHSLPSTNGVKTVYIDSSNTLWVSYNNGNFANISLDTYKSAKIELDMTQQLALKEHPIMRIVEVKKAGKLVLGTEGAGVYIYDFKSKSMHELAGNHKSYIISSLLVHSDGTVLVGSDNRGIYTLDMQTEQLTQFAPAYSPIDFMYCKAHCLYEGSSGEIIAGLYQKGLCIIPSRDDTFRYHSLSPAGGDKNASCITAMSIDSQRNYWIGTDGCGVFTTDGFKMSTAHAVNEGLNSLLVQCVQIDKRQTVWVGTYGGGVQCRQGGAFVTPDFLQPIKEALVMALAYDSATDKLYIATNGDYVYVADLNAKTLTHINDESMGNAWVHALALDKKGNLWIGNAMGICAYNLKTRKINIKPFEGSNSTLTNAFLLDGTRMLAATDAGLYIFEEGKETKHIGAQDGLGDMTVNSMSQHGDAYWIATSAAICRVDKKTLSVTRYNSLGGIDIGMFHRNSVIKPSEQYILFGGDNGIVCFTPQNVGQPRERLHDVFFTSLVIGGERIRYGAEGYEDVLDASISFASSITLPYYDNSFSITFAVPDLVSADRIHYLYMLEGHDDDWRQLEGPKAEAFFTNLPSGCYTLHVKAYYDDMPDVCTERSIDICIRYAWYASPVAKVIYFLLFAALLYYIYKVYRMRREHQEQLRASEQNERMKEAKLNLFTSIAHELRTPLTMIVSPLTRLMETDPDSSRQTQYSIMQRNCNRLLYIVKQITDVRKIDNGQFELHFSETDIVSYINELLPAFEGVATTKRISLSAEATAPSIPVWIDTEHFEKIVTNLLSNAFKFTPDDGVISANTRTEGDEKVIITIYNSGSHIPEEDLAHIYERFYQVDTAKRAAGSGIGLNLAYDLTRLHHGELIARNTPDNGVAFDIVLPLGNAHLTAEEMAPVAVQETTDATSAVAPVASTMLESEVQSEQSMTNPDNLSERKLTVLVVDDDAEICEYLKNELQSQYNVLVARGGNQAWEIVQKSRPDVVITDLMMPDGNGHELCQRIKSNIETNSIPVIMLTSESNEDNLLKSIELKADHFLPKPFNMQLLRSSLNQVVSVRDNMRSKMRRTEVGNSIEPVQLDNADDKLFTRVNDTIKKNIDNSDFGVAELASEVGISRVHLNRKMKERYGVSPNAYIKSLRLKQSAYLLVHNKVNISEVAYTVGFSSHSYFSNAFHDYFGMTPKEFVAFYSKPENDEALQKLLQ